MHDDLSLLYEKFRNPLLRFLRHKVGDEHLAEDLLHEVFIKAGRSLKALKEGQKVQSWLYAIASNTLIDYFRKKKMALTNESDAAYAEELEASVLQELECCLEDFLATLPAAQADVLKAAYFDELRLTEYAERNGLNLSTVKSHASRGKKKLKSLFETCCGIEKNHRGEAVGLKQKERCWAMKSGCR